MPREKWKLTQAAIDAEPEIDPWGVNLEVWTDAPSILDRLFAEFGPEDGLEKLGDGVYRGRIDGWLIPPPALSGKEPPCGEGDQCTHGGWISGAC
ncbi:hypothetical protein [Actinoplanes auranticolor]|uniref:Uncharacterized protein n=1 Tax=Actinoplanes auranticolor TaxID=47988 RepID=A0A919SVZ1_9ACTN|nr:hypothetical protein [Actinoplanes auranticolor]GIM78033.1 hypothetical protein Aau02nite_78910 [Actinoplanes auranticolor]